MSNLFYILGDFAEGPWGDVVAAWCEDAVEPLALTSHEDKATAYLITAKYPEQVQAAVESHVCHSDRPVVWINDYDGEVCRYPSPGVAAQAMADLIAGDNAIVVGGTS